MQPSLESGGRCPLSSPNSFLSLSFFSYIHTKQGSLRIPKSRRLPIILLI